MLKPGTYKLTRNVENPKPDRRVKDDWRCHPVWKAGDEFLVEPVNYKERDDAPTSMWTRIVKVDHRWSHHNLTANDGPQYQALEAALEECPMSDRAFFTAHGIRDWFAQWLILSKRLSRGLLLKLWSEFEEDGHLPSSTPHPKRVTLVEPEPKPQSGPADAAIRELFARIRQGIEDAQSAAHGLAVEVGAAMLVEPAMIATKRFVGEVVKLTRDCELGKEGERAVVTALEAPHYMTLTFFDREADRREVKTGADYKFLRNA